MIERRRRERVVVATANIAVLAESHRFDFVVVNCARRRRRRRQCRLFGPIEHHIELALAFLNQTLRVHFDRLGARRQQQNRYRKTMRTKERNIYAAHDNKQYIKNKDTVVCLFVSYLICER